MKKFKILIPILFFIFSSSCIDRTPRYDPVDACFQVQGETHFVSEVVYFENCSLNAKDYEWSFGDGTISNQRNPGHVFTSAGSYQVTLRAYGYDNSSEKYTHTITVQGSTDLDLLVLYLGTEDPVSNCEVTLFDNEYDWDNLILDNKVDVGTTNANGSIVFEGLNTIEYFIDAFKNAFDNSYYSNYYQGYATDILTKDVVNEYNIYVELLTSESKSKRGKYKIKYIEKSSKEEHERIINAFKLKQ